MKKASKKATKVEADEPRPEYRLDYSKVRPNRFLEHPAPGGMAVLLDPDVAEVFRSSESVNRFLRSAIDAVRKEGAQMPAKKRRAS